MQCPVLYIKGSGIICYSVVSRVMFRCSYQIIQVILISCLELLIHQYLLVLLHAMVVVLSFIAVIRESRGTSRHRYFLLLSQHNWKRFSVSDVICWRNSIWPLTWVSSRWSLRPLQLKSRRNVRRFFWSWLILLICHIASTKGFPVSLWHFFSLHDDMIGTSAVSEE